MHGRKKQPPPRYHLVGAPGGGGKAPLRVGAFRYSRALSALAIALTLVVLVLVFVAPFFTWGKHQELNESINVLRLNVSDHEIEFRELQSVVEDIESVVQFEHTSKRDSVPDAQVSMDSGGVSAIINAAAYYQNGHRLGVHDLRDVDLPPGAPTVGQVLVWNGTHMVSTTLAGHTDAVASVNGHVGAVELTKADIGLGFVLNTMHAHDKTVAPTVNDDALSGYSVGSQWNTLSGATYRALSVVAGAAMWKRLDLYEGAVGSSELDNGAVHAQHFAPMSVDTSALGDTSVTAEKLTANSVLLAHMSVDSVNSAHVVDGSIENADVALGTLTGNRFADATIGTVQLSDASVTALKLAPGAVAGGVGGSILDGSVDANDVDATSVQVRITGVCDPGYQMTGVNAAGGVTCSNAIVVPVGSITTTELATDSVTGGELAPNAVTTAHIADGSIDEVDLAAGYARGVANGVTPLGADGKIPNSFLPDLGITSVTVVADIAARDALSPQAGDVAIVQDAGAPSHSRESFMWTASTWEQLSDNSQVSDVAGKTGSVTLNTADVTEDATRLYYTEARVSANSAVAINTAHAALTAGNPHSVTKADVGLSDVLNVKHEFAATENPGNTHDSNAGFSVGSRYVNVVTHNVFTAVDVTVGAAVWQCLDLHDGAISEIKLASMSVSEEKLQDGSVTSAKIPASAILATHLSPNAVQTDALASQSVTSGKLAVDAVQTANVADNAVVSEKIAPAAVTVSQIATGAVTGPKLATDAVSSINVVDGTLVAADFDGTFLASLGDASGPLGGATDHALARWDGTTGRVLQDSAVSVDDSGNLITSGNVDGRDVSADGATLDAHVADADKHRVIDDVGAASTTTLWSSSKTSAQLDTKTAVGHAHAAADVSDFSAATDARIAAQKGTVNGLATLDGSGKVPASQLTLDGALVYQTGWNADTNTPSIVSGVGTKGHFWIVNVAGTTMIDGISSWAVGDHIVFNGVAYEKFDHTAPVASVQGRTGVITLTAPDITSGVFADSVISSTSVLQHEALFSHSALIGGAAIHSHAALDAHVDDATKHRVIDDSASGTTSLWSASKITSELAAKAASSHSHDASDLTSGTLAAARVPEAAVTQHEAALSITPAQASLGLVANVKQNLAATTAPGVGDDVGDQYSIGSRWLDTVASKEYVCTDATLGAAVWVATTLTGTGDVSGPGGSSTDNALVRWDGTSGQLVQNSAVAVDDSGNIVLSGNVDGRDVSTDGATLDSHVADADKHREIDDSASGTTDLWSASKIASELASHAHTASDVTDFATEVDARITAQKAQANGLATLDGSGKVPASQLSIDGGLTFQATWNAATNTPTITSGVGTTGYFWIVETPGTTNVDGVSEWAVGDWCLFNGVAYEKVDNSAPLTSVAGRTGVVTLVAGDILSGSFADARISQSSVVQHQTALDHDALAGFVADEHIAHTSISISAGSGLSGGGNIAASRTLSLAINTLSEDTLPDPDNDYLLSWDASAGAHKKVLINTLPYKDFANGGEAVGAARSLGNTDNHALSLLTNNLPRVTVLEDGHVGVGVSDPTNLFEARHSSVGNANHIQISLDEKQNTDAFNLGVDTSEYGSFRVSAEDGIYRQALIMAADGDAASTVFGVAGSADSGASWNPKLVVRQDGRVGVGKNDPTEALDVAGNIALSGTVDGVDMADVVQGPASTTSNSVPRYDGTSGKLLKTSALSVSDAGVLSNAGRVVINDQSYATSYALSVQNSGTNSYIEILNNGGTDKGAFFGMESDQFTLYNWQGGDIEFYVDPAPSTGSVKFTMQKTGELRIHDLGAGVVKASASGVLSSVATLGSSDISAGGVALSNMAADSIDSSKVVDGSLTGSDLAAATVTGTQIAAGTLTSAHLAVSAVGSAELADDAVDSAALQTSAVTAAKLATGSVDSSKIADGTVAEVDLVAGYARGAANGVATLGGDGKVPTSQLPVVSPIDVETCADIACRDALSPTEGTMCIVTDAGSGSPETYIYDGSAWIQISDPSQVTSVQGQTGVVSLTTSDISEGSNLYYTSTRVTSHTEVAANSAHRANMANPHGVTKGQVIGVGSIVLGDLASNSVDSAKIVDGSVAEADLVAGYARGAANGVATLDGSGTIPLAQIPTGSTAMIPSGGTAGQVLEKVDGADYNVQWADASGGGGGVEPRYIDVYDNAGGQTFTTSSTTVNLDTVRTTSGAGDFTLASDELTVVNADTYLVIMRVSTEVSSGTSRSTSRCWLERDTGGGFTEVDGSRGHMYNREVTEGDNTATVQVMLALGAGDKLRVRVVRQDGGSPLRLPADSSSLLVTTVGGSSGGGGGGGGVFGSEFYQAASDAESTTSSTTLQTKTSFTTSSLPSGTYRIGYSFEISNAANGVLSEVEVELDGVVVALPNMEADNDYLQFGGFAYQSLSGVVTATIKHRVQTSGTSKIRRARLELWRVA